MILSGDLKKRIELQAMTKTPDGQGGFNSTWNTLDTVWAAIWPTSASERIQGNQPTMTISHRIRIRYRANVKASMRIKFGTRYFSIVSIINPEERRELLDIMAKETTA
jgi:SPP1 family predicted phage head-tail adaptor